TWLACGAGTRVTRRPPTGHSVGYKPRNAPGRRAPISSWSRRAARQQQPVTCARRIGGPAPAMEASAHPRPSVSGVRRRVAFPVAVRARPSSSAPTTNQMTIGVLQVRPVLVLPQGTVQMALPLPLQQGTGTHQTIGVGQVRPANAYFAVAARSPE